MPGFEKELGNLPIRTAARRVIGLAVALVSAFVPAILQAATARSGSQRNRDALGAETASQVILVV